MRKLFLLFLFLAACGGGSAETTSTALVPTTRAPTPTTTNEVTTTTEAATQTVEVFFGVESDTTCSQVMGYERKIPAADDPIAAAFTELLAGPEPYETAAGAMSWLGESTAGMLRGVPLDGGRLTVDFSDFSTLIPNASSSCGSAELLAELTHTAFQFGQVQSVTFAFQGSCERFGEFLQMGCIEISRSEWTP